MFEHWNDPAFQSWTRSEGGIYTRAAGLNEAAFHSYAASEVKAPSDMFMRTRCRIDRRVVTQERMLQAWIALNKRHPLLAATFVMDPSALYDLRIQVDPTTVEDRARREFIWLPIFDSWDEERNRLTNCSRIMHDGRLSQLRIYHDSTSDIVEIVALTHHAIADGSSITMLTRELLNSMAGLEACPSCDPVDHLPIAMEGCLPRRSHSPRQRWRNAILYTIAQLRSSRKPPVIVWQCGTAEPVTRQRIHAFSPQMTRRLLAACRQRGLTVGHLIYAAQAVSFTKLLDLNQETTIYAGTPMAARRMFAEPYRSKTDELVLTVAFLDIFMPAITLGNDRARSRAKLWSMSKIAKKQVHDVITNPNFGDFVYIMLEGRWRGRFRPLVDTPASAANPPAKRETYISYGSSAVGNMDATLTIDSENASRMKILDMNVGMRVRHGETLMHSYSFKGQMILSVMYDDQLGIDVVSTWMQETAELMELAAEADTGDAHRL